MVCLQTICILRKENYKMFSRMPQFLNYTHTHPKELLIRLLRAVRSCGRWKGQEASPPQSFTFLTFQTSMFTCLFYNTYHLTIPQKATLWQPLPTACAHPFSFTFSETEPQVLSQNPLLPGPKDYTPQRTLQRGLAKRLELRSTNNMFWHVLGNLLKSQDGHPLLSPLHFFFRVAARTEKVRMAGASAATLDNRGMRATHGEARSPRHYRAPTPALNILKDSSLHGHTRS